MGKLKDEVLAEPVGQSGRRPVVSGMLKQLSKQELKELIDLLDDQTITGRAICTVLNKRGIRISEATLYRYRASGLYRDLA